MNHLTILPERVNLNKYANSVETMSIVFPLSEIALDSTYLEFTKGLDDAKLKRIFETTMCKFIAEVTTLPYQHWNNTTICMYYVNLEKAYYNSGLFQILRSVPLEFLLVSDVEIIDVVIVTPKLCFAIFGRR